MRPERTSDLPKTVCYIDGAPGVLDHDKLYIEDSKDCIVNAVMGCPSGHCDKSIRLGISEKYYPPNKRWKFHEEAGLPSLSPSVNLTVCGCHFFLIMGRLQWC